MSLTRLQALLHDVGMTREFNFVWRRELYVVLPHPTRNFYQLTLKMRQHTSGFEVVLIILISFIIISWWSLYQTMKMAFNSSIFMYFLEESVQTMLKLRCQSRVSNDTEFCSATIISCSLHWMWSGRNLNMNASDDYQKIYSALLLLCESREEFSSISSSHNNRRSMLVNIGHNIRRFSSELFVFVVRISMERWRDR